MDQEFLVTEQIDAGAQFLEEFGKKFPVRAAFWMRPTEEGQWYLHVVSDQINQQNIDAAYREVSRLDEQMRNLYFDRFRVKLIAADDPSAQAALDIHRRYPGRVPTRFCGPSFGGIRVEGVYIYPSSVATPSP
ncbi:hypothetical protein BH23PLA1_BH23PLA1_23770 [soil metagenome]